MLKIYYNSQMDKKPSNYMSFDWLKSNLLQIVLITAGIILAWGSLNARVNTVEAQITKASPLIDSVPILQERQQTTASSIEEMKSDLKEIKAIQQQILIQLGTQDKPQQQTIVVPRDNNN